MIKAIVLDYATLGENVLNVGLPAGGPSPACALRACCLVWMVAPRLSLPIWGRAKKLIQRIGADMNCRDFLHPSLPWAFLVLCGTDHVGWFICRWPSPSAVHPGPERQSPVLYPSAVPVPEGHPWMFSPGSIFTQADSGLRPSVAKAPAAWPVRSS